MNILMVNLPFAGHTNPTLPLAAALVERGHGVTYVNAEPFRIKIEATGATFVPYQDFPAQPTEQEKKTGSFLAAYRTAIALTESFDLLIYEMFFYPGIDIARRKGIPCVRQFSQPAWSKETWQDTPWVFRLSARLIDVQVLPKRLALQEGLSFTNLRDGIVESQPELNLVYVPEAFQHKRDSFDDSWLFFAPVQKAELTGMDLKIPYDHMKKPIVYISLGSIISNRGFCKECIRAFGGQDMTVVLNTGRIAPESLGKIPENIHAYSFVPQMEVLSHCDVFLTHCGMNSVNEALSLGVPMVAMPFVNDQLSNARQLVRLGLAKRVRSFPSRGKELLAAVQAVYRDTAMKERALRMQDEMHRQMDMSNVVDRIERLVGQTAASSTHKEENAT